MPMNNPITDKVSAMFRNKGVDLSRPATEPLQDYQARLISELNKLTLPELKWFLLHLATQGDRPNRELHKWFAKA